MSCTVFFGKGSEIERIWIYAFFVFLYYFCYYRVTKTFNPPSTLIAVRWRIVLHVILLNLFFSKILLFFINTYTLLLLLLSKRSQALAVSSFFYGEGTGPVVLPYLLCTGKETSLDHCKQRKSYSPGCSHFDDVGIVCNTSKN